MVLQNFFFLVESDCLCLFDNHISPSSVLQLANTAAISSIRSRPQTPDVSQAAWVIQSWQGLVRPNLSEGLLCQGREGRAAPQRGVSAPGTLD
jgi:hypothetical protein